MSYATKVRTPHIGVRSRRVQFAFVDAGEGRGIAHNNDARPNSNCRVQRVVCSAIIVIATAGCYGRVGVEEPRHEQRNEVRHEERHEQPANGHREERRDEERHD